MRSDIDKHRDVLIELQTNQDFILDLCPKEFLIEREERKQARKAKAYNDWHKRLQMDESQDDIIFGEDEVIHDGIKLESIDETTLSKQSTQLS